MAGTRILGNCSPDDPAIGSVKLTASEAEAINPKDLLGTKKVSLSKIPPAALIEMARAMENGAAKYGAFNWRDKNVIASIYVDATLRHLLAWWDGEYAAEDSGIHHLGHALASLAIIVDAEACDCLKDDRPKGGAAAELIARYTRS